MKGKISMKFTFLDKTLCYLMKMHHCNAQTNEEPKLIYTKITHSGTRSPHHRRTKNDFRVKTRICAIANNRTEDPHNQSITMHKRTKNRK